MPTNRTRRGARRRSGATGLTSGIRCFLECGFYYDVSLGPGEVPLLDAQGLRVIWNAHRKEIIADYAAKWRESDPKRKTFGELAFDLGEVNVEDRLQFTRQWWSDHGKGVLR